MKLPTPTTSTQSLLHKTITGINCITLFSLTTAQTAIAGGACTVAKELGNSLAIEWVAEEGETVASATEKAANLLRDKGFTKRKLQDLHVQASTSLPHGHLVIIKSSYTTRIGKNRTSYGCGFNRQASAAAEQAAIRNLRSFSWGWKPKFGYKLHVRQSF